MHPPPTLDDLVARHAGFWSRARTDRPLLARLPAHRWTTKPYPIRSGGHLRAPTPLAPGDVDVERLLGLDRPRPEPLDGDLIGSLGCVYPQAWMESLIGCPILAGETSVVARPTGRTAEEAARSFALEQALGSPWLAVMDAVAARAAGAAGAAWPVQQLHLRGVIDMLAAYLGEETLCLALHDAPGAVATLAGRFTELYLAIARRLLRSRPPWRGGHVSCWKLYAPGVLLDYQVDASNLFSPSAYREHFMEYDRRVLAAFPYSVLHLHEIGLHHVDALASLPEVRTIEINLDRETGVWHQDEVLAACQTIQRHEKGLLVCGELSDLELDLFLRTLDPRGLAIEAWAPAP